MNIIGKYAFCKCSNLTDITFKNNVTILNYAFRETGLKSIKLDTNYIHSNVFYNCVNLEKVDINCKEVNEYAFAYCNIKELYINEEAICYDYSFEGNLEMKFIKK